MAIEIDNAWVGAATKNFETDNTEVENAEKDVRTKDDDTPERSKSEINIITSDNNNKIPNWLLISSMYNFLLRLII